MSAKRKMDEVKDLGARIHELLEKNPGMNYAAVAARLGYSRNSVAQVYCKFKRELACRQAGK